MMVEVRRARYVIEHYAHLQGLRLVPLGVFFLGVVAWHVGVLSWLPGIAGRGAQAWSLAGITVAVVVSFPIRAYYQRHLGAACPRAARTGAVTLTTSCVLVVILASLPPNGWHVSPPVLFVAIVLAFLGCVDGGLRHHYLGIAVACVLFAVAPVFGVSKAARVVCLDLLISLGLLAAGVGDHLVLQRVPQTPEREGVPDVRAA